MKIDRLNICSFFAFFQGTITNILEENVLQPLLVSTSAIQLASETVRSILKIDDIVSTSSKRLCKENFREQLDSAFRGRN